MGSTVPWGQTGEGRGDEREGFENKEFTRPRNKPFPVDAARAALHGVRLPRAALPVRHDSRVDTADADVVERGVQARARYVVVGRRAVEHAVENERVRLRR